MNLIEKEKFIQSANVTYASSSANELLKFSTQNISKITFACSFGAEDVVLLDMIMRIHPEMDIFYLDTDLHFHETYLTRDLLEQKYKKRFLQVKSELNLEAQSELYGTQLWNLDAHLCCNIRKVEPLSKILGNYEGWITGIRREQSPTRAHAQKVEYDRKFGLIKFNPIVDWTSQQIWEYIKVNKLIYNPLHDQNYPSIGCYPCTNPVKPGEDSRAGRWSGSSKTECGLHK